MEVKIKLSDIEELILFQTLVSLCSLWQQMDKAILIYQIHNYLNNVLVQKRVDNVIILSIYFYKYNSRNYCFISFVHENKKIIISISVQSLIFPRKLYSYLN